MIKELKLPELAEGVTSAVLVAILVKPGERVAAEQIAAELENEKATAELPVPFGGVVREIFKKEGDTILVGEPLLTVEVDAADGSVAEASPPGQQESVKTPVPAPPAQSERLSVETVEPPVAAAATPIEVVKPATPASSVADKSDLPAGPEARRLARELGADLRAVSGSGPRGRIQPEDVKAWVRGELERVRSGVSAAGGAAPAGSDVPIVKPMSGVRRKTAEVTAASWREIPHVVQQDQADITDMEALRADWKARALAEGRTPPTVTALLLKVVASALRAFPRFNSSVNMETFEIQYKPFVHLAVAVETGHGLLTPVIRDADRKSVAAISEELAELSAKARDKKLSIEEMTGGCFSVSNLGSLGTTSFGPIVTRPQVAALGVSKADIRPVWNGEAFVPRKILPLSVSYDHRVADGADAARFLRWIAEHLENPVRLVLDADFGGVS